MISSTLKRICIWQLSYIVPPRAGPLCPGRVCSCCAPGTWHTSPHPGPPLPKIVERKVVHVQRSYVFCSSVTITPGFTELTRTFFGASSNATHLQSVAWIIFRLSLFAHLVIWSRAAFEILYANTLQQRYGVIRLLRQCPFTFGRLYPGKERIPLTLDTLTTFPSVFSR